MPAKWTFMVYMAANNDLSENAGLDLEEMRKVGSSEEVMVLTFMKQFGSGDATRRVVQKGGNKEVVETLTNIDSGDPETVLDFIRWGASIAPAENYAVVLWNHGTGWAPDDLEHLYKETGASTGITRGELNVRAKQPIARTLFTTTVKEILVQSSEPARAILSDDGTGHSLDTLELARVIRRAAEAIGHPIDLLGMDACLMSTLEVAYEVHKDVQLVVGSEKVEPNAGWNYESVLIDLTANPAMAVHDLGRLIVDRYIESYRTQPGAESVTQCAIDAQRTGSITEPVAILQQALRTELSSSWPKIQVAQAKSVRFELDMVDLRSFCLQLAESSLSDDVKSAARGVLTALTPGDYIVHEGHHGADVETCGGVTVYFPAPTSPISPYYKDLRFAKEHLWDEFLHDYQQALLSGG